MPDDKSNNSFENPAKETVEENPKTSVKPKKRNWYQTKRFKVFSFIITILIIFRLLLPTIVKKYVNKTLANIPGYYGQVEDIDIALYRGAYVIKGLYLNKLSAETQVPFLNFPETDISIEWKSIFKGKIVSEVFMYNSEVIYLTEDWQSDMPSSDVEDIATEAEKNGAIADKNDWTSVITDLIPIDINHYELINGKFAYVETTAEPNIDLQIHDMNLIIDNIRNVVEKSQNLPSPIMATGASIGNGQLALKGNINLIKEIPDMDLNFSLEGIDLTALNDFSSHYANVDFEDGTVGLYSELAIADSYMDGYFKTLVEDSKFIGKDEPLNEKLWEGFISFFRFLFKNQRTSTFAVKAPIEGDLSKPEAAIFPTVLSIFQNAFVNAFEKEIDEEIDYKDAIKASEEEQEEDKKWWEFWKSDKKIAENESNNEKQESEK